MCRGKVSVGVVLLEADLQVIPIPLIHSERSYSEHLGQNTIQNVAAFSHREAFSYQSEDILLGFNGKDDIALVVALDMELLSPHKDRKTQLSVWHKRR